MSRFVVGPVGAIEPGGTLIVHPEGFRNGIGVFNVEGEFFALRNVCPHMGAPLCQGVVTGTAEARVRDNGAPEIGWIRDGEIIACPWHHWEFEIRTGRTIFPSGRRVRRYPVSIETPEIEARLRRGAQTVPVQVEEATIVLELPDA